MTDTHTADNDPHATDQTSAKRDEASRLGSVAHDIKEAAVNKFDEAVKDVRARTGVAKEGVADDVQDVAMALRRASEQLRGGSAQERTLGTIASSLADASDSIRDKDLGEIVQMVNKVARDNPALFLGGAALLGFAASRYAKASNTAKSAHARQAATRAGVDAFVDEGNPNTQPVRDTP